MEESALMVRGLCRQQGKFELRDISFTLPRGYIMGLVGRMGSGKTTLLKSILNPSLIKSGSVEYEGQAGFIMEDAPFFAEATLKENMDVFKNLYKNYDEKEFYERLKGWGLKTIRCMDFCRRARRSVFSSHLRWGTTRGCCFWMNLPAGLT